MTGMRDVLRGHEGAVTGQPAGCSGSEVVAAGFASLALIAARPAGSSTLGLF